MVGMGNDELKAHLRRKDVQQVQQNHGIQSTGHRHNDSTIRWQQSSDLQRVGHGFQEIVHGESVRVFPGKGEERSLHLARRVGVRSVAVRE